jgi:Protein of unknown function (DUF3102)
MTNDIARSNSLVDLAARIKAEHQAATEAMKRGLEHAFNAGELLLEAKAQLKHGQWLPWLQSCGISERTTQRYIRLAHHRAAIESKSDNVSDLSVSGALAMLSAPRGRKDGEPYERLIERSADLAGEWLELESIWGAPDRKTLFEQAQAAVHRIGQLYDQQPEEQKTALGQFIESCAECAQIIEACKAIDYVCGADSDTRTAYVSHIRDISVAWLARVETSNLVHCA